MPTLLAGALVGALAFAVLAQGTKSGADQWEAPARAAARKNPVASNETSIALGKRTYERHCLVCHGTKGKGDGPVAAKLETTPTDLSRSTLWHQSDGALLWKITEGHTPMPMFKNVTSDEERWPLVNYIRTLAPKPATKDQPKAEKPKEETKP